MTIRELRILPPLAIGRLGAALEPMEAFDLQVQADDPLGYRQIVPQTSFEIDPQTGVITRAYVPTRIRFKDDRQQIRPVAPFLEVFAILESDPETLVPLTTDLLEQEQLDLTHIRWHVEVGNTKLYRRTGDPHDKINACVESLHHHQRHALLGECRNFLTGRTLPLGSVQWICPTPDFPQIRLRYTPAAGLVYGTSMQRHTAPNVQVPDPVLTPERILYDENKGKWRGYSESSGPTLTVPAQIFAGYADGDAQVSWGYLDDECDGFVRIMLRLADGKELVAQATIGAGPPAFAPDTLPIRVVSDELEQLLYGPEVEEQSVDIEEAEEIVRRSLETIRLMNTAVMNGNAVNGRQNVASTMVRQDTGDFERYYEPIAAASLVDNLALRALHERVFGNLAAGAAPWFAEALRRPEEIGDLSAAARRKMPALMRGADGRALTLTRRQIDMVVKAAAQAMFSAASAREVNNG